MSVLGGCPYSGVSLYVGLCCSLTYCLNIGRGRRLSCFPARMSHYWLRCVLSKRPLRLINYLGLLKWIFKNHLFYSVPSHASICNFILYSPSNFSAMSFLPTFSKTSASSPTVASLPLPRFHAIKISRAFCLFSFLSSLTFCNLDPEIPSFNPTSYQQFPTSSLISQSCISVTFSLFLGSDDAEK